MDSTQPSTDVASSLARAFDRWADDRYVALHRDVSARLRPACADMAGPVFDEMVLDICDMKLRWELADQRAADG